MNYIIHLIIATICSLASFVGTFMSFTNDKNGLGVGFLIVFALAIFITSKIKGEL